MQTHKKYYSKGVAKLLAMAALSIAIYGCGQKGDLFLPEQPEEDQKSSVTTVSKLSIPSTFSPPVTQTMRNNKDSL